SNLGELDGRPFNKIPQLICLKCERHLGIPIVYEKENRLAYRLFVGAISKKITKLR
ncbi:MAG: hypothetical protein UT38_C0001G0001, partial [Microgenomates group bacterium GW2011_GWA2_39_19]